MYVSRVLLDRQNRETMVAMVYPQRFHGAVERAFPGERRRRLWRLDQLGERLYLMILSEDRPDLSGIVNQFGQGAPGETKDYAPLLERIARGGVWRFRLTANPTVGKPPACAHDRVREGERGGAPMERGKVTAHITPEFQKKWLLDRAEKHGFLIKRVDVTGRKWLQFRKHGLGRTVTLLSVTYEGVLEVTDPVLFRETLTSGIGRGKAYGQGLLTVARAGERHG